ncbi:hypothetical protein CICLE_v10022448mg [Citrus x clementina]|uniref:LIM zinc-binding domain-containing protein n=1 Tax=Citrus clementina TaxID=85681 RepID=V4VY33_CITCL|nr:hypothetical protein CICLE_v10022448mg [Citrus x clementina]
MAFTGTLDKCKACDKTVYVVDMLSLEGMPYHKSCFKCSHCKGTLVMSNYSSMDGVLYCKPHFEQLFKESGNFSKNFQTDKCAACEKTVYPLEKVTMEGDCFHKTCFRCAHGGCPLTHSSYAALDGVLYCKHHFAQLFMEKGNYSHVLKAANHKRTASSSSTSPAEQIENKPDDESGAEDQTEEQS